MATIDKYRGFLVRSQLEEFYRARGCSDHCIDRLVEKDLKRIEENSDTSPDKNTCLSKLFNWAHSPEGYRYWRDRYNPLF